jgi:hypothetical protein
MSPFIEALRTKKTAIIELVIVLGISLIFSRSFALADTFTVTSSADDSDTAVGDGQCDSDASIVGDQCTLRSAIEETNVATGTDSVVINFNIPGGGVQTISPQTALPPLTRPAVTIDGTTQPGSSCGNLWGLDGYGNADPAHRHVDPVWNIILNGDIAIGAGSTIKGLGISALNVSLSGNNSALLCNHIHLTNHTGGIMVESDGNHIGGPWIGDGNVIDGYDPDSEVGRGPQLVVLDGINNFVQGNFIGTNKSGSAAVAPDRLHVQQGILLYGTSSMNNTIGGATAGARNLISGVGGKDDGAGVEIQEGASNNTVVGNYIGTDLTGTRAIPNGGGILVYGSNNTIGGATSNTRNIIAGNITYGVILYGMGKDVIGNIVEGNFIGLGADGTTAVPNQYGVLLLGQNLGPVTNNTIGGVTVGAGNIIANNFAAAISTFDVNSPKHDMPACFLGASGTGNSFLGNSIYNNGGLGIDLAPCVDAQTGPIAGITPNDPLDTDTGPNNFQNYPTITRVTGLPTRTVAYTKFQGAPSQDLRIEFFWSPSSTTRQGKVFLGFKNITTNRRGMKSFVARDLLPIKAPGVITATATDSAGNTSEFSAGVIPRIRAIITPTQEAMLEREVMAEEQ